MQYITGGISHKCKRRPGPCAETTAAVEFE